MARILPLSEWQRKSRAKGGRVRPRVRNKFIYEMNTTSTISRTRNLPYNASLVLLLASTSSHRFIYRKFTEMELFCEYINTFGVFRFGVWLCISLAHHSFLIFIIFSSTSSSRPIPIVMPYVSVYCFALTVHSPVKRAQEGMSEKKCLCERISFCASMTYAPCSA